MTPAHFPGVSMTRTALPLVLLGLTLASLPLASAQEGDTRPDDAAWVDDCPPDMMCAADTGNPGTLGPEGCIDCMQPIEDGEPAATSAEDAKDKVPAPSLLAALGIVGVAAFAVSLLGRR